MAKGTKDVRSEAHLPIHGLKAKAIAIARHMAPLAAHCQVGLGKLYQRRSRWDEAVQEFDAAISCYRDLGMSYWLEIAKAEARRKEPAGLLEIP